jgi:hypothetical protein
VIIGRPDRSPEKKSHPQRAPTNRSSQVRPMSSLLPKVDIAERGLHTQRIFVPRQSFLVSAQQ